MTRFVFATVCVLSLFIIEAGVAAADAPADKLAAAHEHFQKGRYGEALEVLDSVAKDGAKDVDADTSNGPVNVKASGKVVIDTSNGEVSYSGASTDFVIDSSNGDVDIDITGDWSGQGVVDTSNGSITLNCTGTLKCAMKHDTSNGKLHLEGPPLAGAGGQLKLETSNGSIWVKHGAQ